MTYEQVIDDLYERNDAAAHAVMRRIVDAVVSRDGEDTTQDTEER